LFSLLSFKTPTLLIKIRVENVTIQQFTFHFHFLKLLVVLMCSLNVVSMLRSFSYLSYHKKFKMKLEWNVTQRTILNKYRVSPKLKFEWNCRKFASNIVRVNKCRHVCLWETKDGEMVKKMLHLFRVFVYTKV